MEDWQLMQEFVETRSETAFSSLANRYLDMVYSSAFRRLGAHQAAQDTTQAVFVLLAQKAHLIPSKTPLIAWLYQAVRFKALEYGRSERRRMHYEREAAAMIQQPEATDAQWKDIVPHLEQAMDTLAENDRIALLLKYFQRQSFPEIGAAFKVGEDAARMRVNRALDRLRSTLAKKGIECSTGALAALMTAYVVEAAPVSLANSMRSMPLPHTVVRQPYDSVAMFLTGVKVPFAAVACLVLIVALCVGLVLPYPEKASKSEPSTNKPLFLVKASKKGLSERGISKTTFAHPMDPAREEGMVDELRRMLYSPIKQGVVLSRALKGAIEQLRDYSETSLPTLLKVLIAAVLSNDETAQSRAICGLELLREQAQEALPVLLDYLKREGNGRGAMVLKAALVIVPNGKTLEACFAACPDLWENAQELTSALGEAIAHYPAAIPEIQKVLEPYLISTDADIRFSAALALAHFKIQDKTAIAAILKEALKDENKAFMAVQSLPSCGAVAKMAAPAIQELIASTQNTSLKEVSIEALAKIASETSSPQPELSNKVQELEQAELLSRKIEFGLATVDDLVKGLDSPQARFDSAYALGKMGASAESALPALRQWLETYENDLQYSHNGGFVKDIFATAIKQIDPESPKPLFTADELEPSMRAVYEALSSKHPSDADALRVAINKRITNLYWTHAEIVDLAEKIARTTPEFRDVFVSQILKLDAAMNKVFASKQQARNP